MSSTIGKLMVDMLIESAHHIEVSVHIYVRVELLLLLTLYLLAIECVMGLLCCRISWHFFPSL